MDSPLDPPPIRKWGVVAVIRRRDRLLVIRRSQFVRAPGMHCFPGGGIEPGESESQAVCREVHEELSLACQPIRRLWEGITPWQVHLAWWLVEIDPAAEPIANSLEVESFAWLTPDEILALPNLLASNVEFLEQWASLQRE
ncbi:MAG: NUDIX domain-containing protein [Pirellulaceae bacterium]|nr:NUDIX domain-containing protein [Pirellulaceae bacterium]